MNANNVNNRIADGVVALTQGSSYQPMSYKPNLCQLKEIIIKNI